MSKVYFGKDSIRPDFTDSNEEQDLFESQISRTKLKNTEQNAISDNPAEELQDARTQEQESDNFSQNNPDQFTFSGQGKNKKDAKNLQTTPKNKLKKGLLKKGMPLMLIVGGIVALFAVFFIGVSTLGHSIETLLTSATDTMFGSYSENSLREVSEQMAGKRGKMSDYFKNRLEDNGISVNDLGNNQYSFEYGGDIITADNLKSEYVNNLEFREAFTKAKRGRSSNYYDIPAAFIFTKLGLSRNLFKNYKSTGDNNVDTANYRATESAVFDGTSKTRINTLADEPVLDEDGNPKLDADGNPITQTTVAGEDASSIADGTSSKVKAQSYLVTAAGKVADAGDGVCNVLRVANMVATTIAGVAIYQAIHYFMGIVENFSKTTSGYGEEAAQNQALNDFSDVKTTTYIDAETGEEKEVTGAMLESQGLQNAMAGETPDTSKTKNYSVGAAFITTAMAIGTNRKLRTTCGGVKLTSAAVSFAVGLASGGIVSSLTTIAKKTILNAAIAAGIAATLSVLVPRIASVLFENKFNSLEGVPAGEEFTKGAALANKRVARSSNGQLLANAETATAYSKQIQLANNFEAELDRKDRSPLDASSPNTFLGNLLTKFAVLNGSSTISSYLTTLGNLSRSALSSVSKNTVNAISTHLNTNLDYNSLMYLAEVSMTEPDYSLNGTHYSEVLGDESICENLADIGAACDMYGSSITATVPEVMNISSDDPKYLEIVNENTKINSDGFREVIPNSLLANKINFCDERNSPDGVYDVNIANAFNISLGFGDNIPIISSVVDAVNAVIEMSPETEGWARGTYCVYNPETNPYSEKMAYLQHFQEDQRLASQLKFEEVTDADGKDHNAVTAYKEEYYSKNPIDTSTAGLLALYTGQSKETAEEVLALIYLENYLANYEPPKLTEDPENYTYEDDRIIESEFFAIAPKYIIYDIKTQGITA